MLCATISIEDMVMDDCPPNEPGQNPATALSVLHFLLGNWKGKGQHHGVEIHGQLMIRMLGDGGFVEQRETLLEEERIVHEDLAIYRWDPPTQSLRVQHYAPPGLMLDHYVLVDEARGGIRWIAGPGAARIEFWPEGMNLCLAVTLPGESEPSLSMKYVRMCDE